MTDAEMIKLLRNSPFTFNDIVADRIEQLMETQELLVAQRNAAWERDTYSFREWKAAEAKLTKAVEVLREFAKQNQTAEMNEEEYENADFEGAYNNFIAKARTVLAELDKE